MRLSTCSVLLLTLPFAAGCAFQGERSRTDMCPPGESCSALTPDGLSFRGAALSSGLGSSSLATAVGGWQTIEVEGPIGAIRDRFGVTAEPAATFAVSDVRPPRLTLRALAQGSGLLRVSDSVTGELFDRVSISAAPLDHVALEAELLYAADPRFSPQRAPLLLRGTSGRLILRLRSATDQVLADEGTTLGVSAGDTVRRVAWDLAEVSTTSDHTVLSVQSGASRVDVTVHAVDRADTVELLTPSARATPIAVDGTASICFVATAGGELVSSLGWRFVGTAGIAVRPADTTGALLPASCIEVDGVTLGPALLEASLGTTSLSVGLEVTAQAPARAALVAPGRMQGSPVPGERARSTE